MSHLVTHGGHQEEAIAIPTGHQQSPLTVTPEAQANGSGGRRRAAGRIRSAESTLPIVVLVSKDVPALPVLLVLNPALLACTHVPIRPCTRLCLGDMGLSAF